VSVSQYWFLSSIRHPVTVGNKPQRGYENEDMRLSKTHDKLLAAERLKATGRLASEIAHELNTPLGGIWPIGVRS
jgi:C4-dicarboxylate-specific signal transduction histidine kinase